MPIPKQTRPYGTWHSPLAVHNTGGDHRLYDAAWDTTSGALVWQERRAGGSALVVQYPDENPRDLLRAASIGGRILFGGGGFTVGNGTVVYAGDGGRLYTVPLAGGSPRPITPGYGAVAAPTLSPDTRWVLYVHSYEGRDALVVVPADGSDYPRKLLDGTDFVMHPAWSADGAHIACITWNHPHMPWDASQLHLLALHGDDAPHAASSEVIAGATGGESVFGAAFSPDGRTLAYTSDRDGWWQLYRYNLETGRHTQLTDDQAEYGVPAWLQSMRTFGWARDGRSLYALRNADSRYTLRRIPIDGGDAVTVGGLDEYTHLEQIAVSATTGEVAVIAGATHLPDRLVTVSPEAAAPPRIRTRSDTGAISPDYLARAANITWETVDGTTVHGLYYPPTHPHYTGGGLPPLVVYIHSGPTRQRFARYFPEPHLFTTRGFAVLEPNYRGSTGYGRAFKQMLNGAWGVAEVADCVAGAQTLVERGLADGNKLIVMGESSGGYSVLQSLVLRPGFYRAGIAQAPVADQFEQVRHTHKFERFYNDTLLGPLPGAAALYRERSPLLQADAIRDPLALFHGEDDTVVPSGPSGHVAAALRRRSIPHLFRLYPGEGHSFRAAQADYIETALDFLMRQVVYT